MKRYKMQKTIQMGRNTIYRKEYKEFYNMIQRLMFLYRFLHKVYPFSY